MNSTSPSSSLVRMAARSPARSRAGPDVTCRRTPISVATMPASVVLPSPGGPANSRWSAAWPRRRAASRMIVRCSLSSAWPTKSSSGRGRRPPLVGDLGVDLGRRQASGSSSSSRIGDLRSSPAHGQALQRLLQQRRRHRRRRRAARAARRGSRRGRSRGRPARRGRRPAPTLDDAGRARGGADRRPTSSSRHARAATSARPAAGPRSSCRRRARGTARRCRRRPACGAAPSGRVHRQDGQRQAGPDAVGAEQRLEAVALVAA